MATLSHILRIVIVTCKEEIEKEGIELIPFFIAFLTGC